MYLSYVRTLAKSGILLGLQASNGREKGSRDSDGLSMAIGHLKVCLHQLLLH